MVAIVALPARGRAADRALGPVSQFPPAFAAKEPAAEMGRHRLSEAGYHPGLGETIVSAGRFGFSKGDGLLDVSYPKFGRIEKPDLADHPANSRHQVWSITFEPPGAEGRGAEKRVPYRFKDQQGEISVNWISTVWDSHLVAGEDFAGRKRGAQVNCRVTYSLASPGILVESDDRGLRLGLGETPGYARFVLPLKNGLALRDLSADRSVYRQTTDGSLTDNWILLWPREEFPAVPVLVVLKENPAEIRPAIHDGRLECLDLVFPSQLGHVILATPFGVRALSPEEAGSPKTLTQAIRLSRFWSKALLAYIVDCRECFKIDEATDDVSIAQQYEYRVLTDAWHSKPAYLAPYPPALALAADVCQKIQIPSQAVDLDFPTKYGPLKAIVGSDWAQYRLPGAPVSSRIPLAPVDDTPARREIRERNTLSRPLPDKPLGREFYPGFWSRKNRNIADCASMLGERALLGPWLDPASRRALEANARDFLIDCLDDQPLFAKTALFASIEHTPESAGRLERPIWFERTEPFTKQSYRLSYTVPPVRSEGKSITDYPATFTDLEWGSGLGLYGMWQMARVANGWDLVKKHWPLVKGVYALFEVQQDWACMSASGSETGSRWTDTASYGGYLAFRKMAEAIGDREAARAGAYLHAKHAAMRMAMFTAGRYLHAFYGQKPWLVYHDLREHPRPGRADMSPYSWGSKTLLPEEVRGANPAVQKFSLYSLVAEGTGYETPDLFYRWIPGPTAAFVRLYQDLFPDWNTAAFCQAMNARHSHLGGITAYEMLLFELRDPGVDTATIRRHWKAIEEGDLVRRYLSPMYGRWIAAHEYAHALVETRDDPAWLDDWQNATILSADYDRQKRRALIQVQAAEGGRVDLGEKRPRRVALDGRELPLIHNDVAPGWWYSQDRLRIVLPRGGKLEIDFE